MEGSSLPIIQEIQKEHGVYGGIAGYIGPFDSSTYHNYLYYCYNIGNISGDSTIGTIVGSYSYIDADYIYGLEKETGDKPIFGDGNNLQNATQKGIFDKSTLTSNILSNFGESFKADYEGESVNNGFPILMWQPKRSDGDNV